MARVSRSRCSSDGRSSAGAGEGAGRGAVPPAAVPAAAPLGAAACGAALAVDSLRPGTLVLALPLPVAPAAPVAAALPPVPARLEGTAALGARSVSAGAGDGCAGAAGACAAAVSGFCPPPVFCGAAGVAAGRGATGFSCAQPTNSRKAEIALIAMSRIVCSCGSRQSPQVSALKPCNDQWAERLTAQTAVFPGLAGQPPRHPLYFAPESAGPQKNGCDREQAGYPLLQCLQPGDRPAGGGRGRSVRARPHRREPHPGPAGAERR